MNKNPEILIEVNTNLAQTETRTTARSLNAAPSIFNNAEAIFETDLQTQNDRSLTRSLTANSNTWMSVNSQEDAENEWDHAHALVEKYSDRGVHFAEPNIEHRGLPPQMSVDFSSKTYFDEWAHPETNAQGFAWHLKHSQLLAARLPDPGEGKRIRIGHLDTGYDPNHVSSPKFILKDLERNFVAKDNNLMSAIDRLNSGQEVMKGHGTSTLGILAGNFMRYQNEAGQVIFEDYLGGAPFAEIVPIRISRSVILLKTKRFVEGLRHTLDSGCDVVSMSMGGVASKLWAKMINRCYESGMTVVTAAGNNFGSKPTRLMIYPARFNRVIGVCGITYSDEPYFKHNNSMKVMQGNWGPKRVMDTAMAAYTPNVPFARHSLLEDVGGITNVFTRRGGGTSAATPQVAAAAALWLQKYADQQYTHPWQRVEAVRNALFSSAKKVPNIEQYIGNGALQAKDALAIAPILANKPSPKDSVKLPFFQLFRNYDKKDNLETHDMYELEIHQLTQHDEELQALLDGVNLDDMDWQKKVSKNMIEVLAESPNASRKLRKFLKRMAKGFF